MTRRRDAPTKVGARRVPEDTSSSRRQELQKGAGAETLFCVLLPDTAPGLILILAYGFFLFGGRLVFWGGGVGCGLGDRTLSGSFGGRLSFPFWAKAPADTTPIVTRTNSSRINFFISAEPPNAFLAHRREKEMRTTGGAIKMPKTWPRWRPDFGGYFTSKQYGIARFGLASHRMVQVEG